jgi:DNA-binding response OmpR family regulator
MRILYLKTNLCSDRSAQYLEMSKYEIVEAASFDDALRLLKTGFFDVLVLDDHGNPETVQFTVGARAVRPEVPVFVMSAWGADLGMALDSIEAINELATAC